MNSPAWLMMRGNFSLYLVLCCEGVIRGGHQHQKGSSEGVISTEGVISIRGGHQHQRGSSASEGVISIRGGHQHQRGSSASEEVIRGGHLCMKVKTTRPMLSAYYNLYETYSSADCRASVAKRVDSINDGCYRP
eukprot:1182076-Prorocentrum_minimum.AAC.2